MNCATYPSLVDPERRGPAALSLRVGTGGGANCFHCGDSCGEFTFTHAARTFCSHDCVHVHDLLTEAGLGQFYRLSPHPGTRVRRASNPETWQRLDEPDPRARPLEPAGNRLERVTFRVPAMRCAACVWLLERLSLLRAGIAKSQVHFPRREVTIDFNPSRIKRSELAALLTSIGYEPALASCRSGHRWARALPARPWLQTLWSVCLRGR